jgi:vacuole morphology and inheritance protein 14
LNDLQVVLVDLEVLAEISSSRVAQKFPLSEKIDETTRLSADIQQRLKLSMHGRLNSYFSHFMISLLKLFSTDRQLLDDRGSVIIRFQRLLKLSVI